MQSYSSQVSLLTVQRLHSGEDVGTQTHNCLFIFQNWIIFISNLYQIILCYTKLFKGRTARQLVDGVGGEVSQHEFDNTNYNCKGQYIIKM